jgi:hypothetical protein
MNLIESLDCQSIQRNPQFRIKQFGLKCGFLLFENVFLETKFNKKESPIVKIVKIVRELAGNVWNCHFNNARIAVEEDQ